MRINTNNDISFQKIYYTKFPIFDFHMRPIKAYPDHYAIEEKPLVIAKEIMKSSNVFRDLDKSGTDIFVYMGAVPHENKLLGVLSSTFFNPYTKKADTLSIQADGFSKEIIFEEIKKVADKLPCINELKENLSGHPSILRTSDQWWIA